MIRQFYDQHLRPDYDAWLENLLDERLAKNAVANANNMAARVYHFWRAHDPSKIGNAENEAQFRNYIAEAICDDFALVRDVAEAFKHVELSRGSKRVTRYDQTGRGSMGWGEGRFGEGVYGGGEQLVVSLDDGSKRPLSSIMKNVITMWELLMDDWGL